MTPKETREELRRLEREAFRAPMISVFRRAVRILEVTAIVLVFAAGVAWLVFWSATGAP
jgi:hypothetical protein